MRSKPLGSPRPPPGWLTRARDAGWTHEDYLAAVLEREVSARNASGAQLRIRAAGFGGVKTLEDFDFDAQQVGALAS